MLSPKAIGTITEYECATYLMKLGLTVSMPIGDNAKYDLIVEINKKLYKLQCKHSHYSDGGIIIECTTNINTRTRLETYTYERSDVDYFCTFYDNMCYMIPFEDGKQSFKLRLQSTRNNNQFGINWADEYEAPVVIKSIIDPTYHYSSKYSKPDVPYEKLQYIWITNGKVNHRFQGDINKIPEGFRRGRTDKPMHKDHSA